MKLVIIGKLKDQIPNVTGSTIAFPGVVIKYTFPPINPLETPVVQIIENTKVPEIEKQYQDYTFISMPLNEFGIKFLNEILKYASDAETIWSIYRVRKFIELLEMSSTFGKR